MIEVVSVRTERLDAITADECLREGFPGISPEQFVAFFCQEMRCTPDQEVRRIEFRYIEPSAEQPSPVRCQRVDRMALSFGKEPKPRRKIGDMRTTRDGRRQVLRQARSGDR